jgi:hypothetical protein
VIEIHDGVGMARRTRLQRLKDEVVSHQPRDANASANDARNRAHASWIDEPPW